MSIKKPATDADASGVTRRRRRRDPQSTREAILEAARTLLAKDGPEGISLSQVAHLAEVNRGTAYQHFETREKLIDATVASVSDKLFRAVFGDPATVGERLVERVDIAAMSDRLSDFAMENRELTRVWLMQVLASPDPTQDMFWREYESSFARFAATDLAEPGIDVEVLSVLMLAGTFLWPIWAQAHDAGGEGRLAAARRFSRETLRLSLHGTLRTDAHPQIARRLVEGDDPQ